MLTILELRQMAVSLSSDAFVNQLGPFALVQRPPNLRGAEDLPEATAIGKAPVMESRVLSLLFEFDGLVVATLPPLSDRDALTVGRQADCDLILDDASVSKRHAVLHWDGQSKVCTLEDLASTNGTFLNAGNRVRQHMPLRDGDIVSFGDAPFWFLLSPTLHARLRDSGTDKLGSRSG